MAALCARRLVTEPSLPHSLRDRIMQQLARRDVLEKHPLVRRVLAANRELPESCNTVFSPPRVSDDAKATERLSAAKEAEVCNTPVPLLAHLNGCTWRQRLPRLRLC